MALGTLTAWATFFNTAAESAATLTGLVIVAVSVNLQKIVAFRHLPSRAWASVCGLLLVLAMSLAALAPQPAAAFAVEVDIGVPLILILHVVTASQVVRGHREVGRPLTDTLLSLVVGWTQVIPFTIGAVLLALGRGEGLYWLAVSIVATLVASVFNAWILLVEIIR